MKRLYFDDKHGRSEANSQQIILLQVRYLLLESDCRMLYIYVIGASAANPSTLFRSPDLI